MKKVVAIAFLAGLLGQVLGLFVAGTLYRFSASVFEFLFRDWFLNRGHTESIYYFGSFWIGLPTAVSAFLVGLATGFFLSGRTSSLAVAGMLGWCVSYIAMQLVEGMWWLNSPPYRVVFALSLALALVFLSVGTFMGPKIKRRTKGWCVRRAAAAQP